MRHAPWLTELAAQTLDAANPSPPAGDDQDYSGEEDEFMDDSLFVDEPKGEEHDPDTMQAMDDLASGLIPRLASRQKSVFLKIGRDLGVAMAESVAARAAVGQTMVDMGLLEGEELNQVLALIKSIPRRTPPPDVHAAAAAAAAVEAAAIICNEIAQGNLAAFEKQSTQSTPHGKQSTQSATCVDQKRSKQPAWPPIGDLPK